MVDRSLFHSALRWLALGRMAAQVVSWAATIFVLRLLLPQDYGVAAICTAIVGAVAIVSDFALSAGLVQAHELRDDQMRGVLGAVLLIALACTVAVWLAAPALGRFFDAPHAVPMIRVAAVQLLFGPWSAVPDAMLRRQLRFQALAAVEFVSIVSGSGLTLALALGGANAWALVLGPIGGAAVRLAMLYSVAPTRLWPSRHFAPALGLIRFGATMALSRVAGYVFGQSDVWIAARAFPNTQLGEYSVAMHVAMLPMSKAMAVLNDVLFPLVAKMNRDGEDTRAPLLAGLRLGMYVAVPVLWGLALAAPDLLPLLIGEKWSKAVPVVQIACLFLPLRGINAALATVLQGSGRTDLDLRNTLTGALILPPLFVVGAMHGPLGLAGAWAVGLPFVVVFNLARCRHALGVTPQLVARAALVRPLALGAALAAVGLGTRSAISVTEPSWLALVVTAACSQGVYWALLAAIDREMLRQLLAVADLRPEGRA
jgi:O-antigen/teichoic acid export membrane protein